LFHSQDLVKKGETAYIDPRYHKRSIAEAALVGVIGMCFRYYPDDRPSIFEIAVLLREALTKAEAADEAGNRRS
jgi:hypothetical protein